jgi:hypothetical protein
MEPQTVEVSLYTEARKLQENLEVIEAELTTDPTMVGIEVKTTRKEALTQQVVIEEKIEGNKRDFQARLEVVEARTGRRRTHAGICIKATPLRANRHQKKTRH